MDSATSRFLHDRMAHAWTTRFLAQDPTDLVRWGATCRAARSETSDENEALWAYVWTQGLGQPKPLGPRQVRRAKAYVLEAHAKVVRKAQKKPCTLSQSDIQIIDTYRRTTDSSAFPHIAIDKYRYCPHYPGEWVWRALGATTLDFHKIDLIKLQRRIKEKIEMIDHIERYEGIDARLMVDESKRLKEKKLKRKKRTRKPRKKKKAQKQ